MSTQKIHAETYKLLMTDGEPWRDDGTRIVTLEYKHAGVPYTSKLKVYHVGKLLRLVCPMCSQRVKSVAITWRGPACDDCAGKML